MLQGKTYVMVADDEQEIRDILQLMLKGEGYEVILAEDGEQVLEQYSPDLDLLILDVNMPKMTGLVAAMKIRESSDVPIIFLTAYSAESDKIIAFSAGADDYVVKPFSNMELLMRIRAILRRSKSLGEAPQNKQNGLVFHDIYLDLDRQSVVKDNELILLTYTEFKILELFLSNPKKIFSIENIYQSIWGEEAVGDSAIIVHIKNIRKKLGDSSRHSKYIKTAWGKGYYAE